MSERATGLIGFPVNRDSLERLHRAMITIDATETAISGFNPNRIYGQLARSMRVSLEEDSVESRVAEISLSYEDLHAIGSFLIGFHIDEEFPKSGGFSELMNVPEYDSIIISLPWAEYLPDFLHVMRSFIQSGGNDEKGFLPFLERVVDKK